MYWAFALVGDNMVIVSIWVFALLSGLPTALLFYLDRHRAPGHCATCGYNLRGNTTAICPECGSAVDKVGS